MNNSPKLFIIYYPLQYILSTKPDLGGHVRVNKNYPLIQKGTDNMDINDIKNIKNIKNIKDKKNFLREYSSQSNMRYDFRIGNTYFKIEGPEIEVVERMNDLYDLYEGEFISTQIEEIKRKIKKYKDALESMEEKLPKLLAQLEAYENKNKE
jgi:hypothetical protein